MTSITNDGDVSGDFEWVKLPKGYDNLLWRYASFLTAISSSTMTRRDRENLTFTCMQIAQMLPANQIRIVSSHETGVIVGSDDLIREMTIHTNHLPQSISVQEFRSLMKITVAALVLNRQSLLSYCMTMQTMKSQLLIVSIFRKLIKIKEAKDRDDGQAIKFLIARCANCCSTTVREEINTMETKIISLQEVFL